MEKAKISAIQLFAMIFMFELGSALVVSYGITAKKDAWLAILLGMFGGLILFFIYYFLFRQYPNLPLTGYARKIFGKYVGWIIGLLYVVFLLYDAARDLRDFGDLLLSSTLTETPLSAINILLVLAICYVLYLGIEVLARTAEVFVVILIFIGFTGNLLVYFSGNVDIHNLQPFLENGWKPIVTTAFPLTTFFPFGEMIVFTMLLPYLNRPELTKKVWLSSVILSGLILSYTTSLNIAVLGVEAVERSTFPLLSTIGKVNLFDFIQRMDVLVVFTLLINMFFKIAILFYGAVIGIVDLFNLKNHQQIVLPAGIILIFLSMTIASDFVEHIEEGQKTAQYYFFPLIMVIIPLFMLLVTLIRNGFKKKSRSKSNATK
ncbi:GerAB/ArcD/ProY family transporter [Metabacillus litoralis]|jgi:spore germination protein KB|uniref:GerAB/ArcD/ProY family transporter n=1 Tax=Metabacillus litoralis TaxID=152268 RepID=UPI00203CC57C|nr:GerAB/ArcD/ProY family transporter [Metabacillus litoralis]MCM3654411.1 spore germination protein [Metabacillus litoralis]